MWAIAIKDMRAIGNSVQVWLPMLIVPVIMCVLLPGGLILGVRHFGVEGMDNVGSLGSLDKMLAALPPSSLKAALDALASPEQKLLYFALNYMFVPFFLLIPLMLSSVITANSFAVEKERKTLESLLFSPIDIPSLFLGKVLSAFVPSMLVTWLCTFLYGLVVDILAYPIYRRLIFPTTNWIVLIFWAVPAVSLVAVFINVIISAKVKGFQEAYQLGGLLVLPVLGLIMGQAMGALIIDVRLLGWIGALVWVLDFGLLRFIVRHFDRNKLFESQVS